MITKIKRLYQTHMTFKEKSKVLPLTSWSIFFIIILNIFVFTSIQMGIAFQTKIVNNPNTKFNSQCRNIIEYPSKLKKIDNYIYHTKNSDYSSYGYKSKLIHYKGIVDKELDSRCIDIIKKVLEVRKNTNTDSLKGSIKSIESEIRKKEKDLRYIRNNYNTVLFEKIANQNQKDSILNMDLNTRNSKIKYDNLKNNLEKLRKQKDDIKNEFKSNKYVNNLYKSAINNNSVISEYKMSMKFYHIKKSLIAIIFTLPLIIFFYYRMNLNNRLNRYSRYMISKNLFIVSVIPIIFEVCYMVYQIIPHVFLKKVITFFYSIQIPFIAYYILIGIIVLFLTFIVIKIQNKKERDRLKRLESKIDIIEAYKKNICSNCKNKVSYISMNNCPYCSNQLKEDCNTCDNKKIKHLKHCHNCGK